MSAGLGTRLRPVTDHVPKCLVPIGDRPLMEYWLQLLVGGGVKPILVNTHYLASQVVEYVRGSPYASDVVTTSEKTLLGTAGTLLRNREFFADEPIMLIHGDNLSLFDLRAFQDTYVWRPQGVEITMMTFTAPNPETCGIVEVDDKGIVRAFHEKVANPPGNVANAAVYIVSPQIFYFLEALGKEVIDFSTEVLPNYLGRINTFHNDVYHRDIGVPESLMAAQQEYPIFEKAYTAR